MCATPGCNNTKIKDTNTQTHRYCVECRDKIYTAALATCNNIRLEVISMRRNSNRNNWMHINAGENRGYNTTIGGTNNPLRVEKEAWYKFIKGNSAYISLSGVLSKHYTCPYGGDTIIVHITKR